MTTTNTHTPTALQQALERLQAGVTHLMTGPGWQAALDMRARLHSYSFLNTSLILAQQPDATAVAGYRKWQELGRQVRKGEHGIAILAPLLKKDPEDPDDPEARILYGFRAVKVFDITQTDGEPLPDLPHPQLLEQDDDSIRNAINAVTTYAKAEGLTIRHDLSHPHALGSYRHTNRLIQLKPGLPALQHLKTLVHELAHALLHDPATDKRELAELEAESTAYLTCHHLGLDTSHYSFPYLAGWAPDLQTLLHSGERAARTAERILNAINPIPTKTAPAATNQPRSIPTAATPALIACPVDGRTAPQTVRP